MSDVKRAKLTKEEIDTLLQAVDNYRKPFEPENVSEEDVVKFRRLDETLQSDLRDRTGEIIETLKSTEVAPSVFSIVLPTWDRLEQRIDALWGFWMLTMPWIGKGRTDVPWIGSLASKIAAYRAEYPCYDKDPAVYYRLLHELLGYTEDRIETRTVGGTVI